MSLNTALQQPYRFEFIQVLRLLRSTGQRNIRLCAEPMPNGSAPEVQAVERDGMEYRVRLGLEALSGCCGVVPNYIYEALLAGLHQEDRALEQFLEIFNHRYYQLLAGELESMQLLVREEREQAETNSLTRPSQRTCLTRLSALPGHREAASDLLHYTVLLGLKVRSLSGLKQLLSDYFQLQVHVSVVQSSSYRLPNTSLTRLGTQNARNNRLGKGLLLGCLGTLNFHRLEVLVEPRNHQEYREVQEDPLFAGRLREIVQAYLREITDLRLYLYVKRAFIKQPVLSARPGIAVRLGEANCLAPQVKPGEYRKILIQ